MKYTPLYGLILLNLLNNYFAQPVFAEESHPGIGNEALYSEAVLAYNKKNTDEAIRILDELLKEAPNNVEALELKALSLKSKGDDARSLEAYSRLLKLKPESERGPYHFEVGIILNKQKKFQAARPHFERAIALNVNVAASHLFLGLINFGNKDYPAAEASFKQVRSGGTPELKVVSNYYLGMIHFKTGNGSLATAELVEARELASGMPESKMAMDIKAGVDKALAPFTNAQWFANVTAMGQYDSNISQVPAGAAANAVTGQATPKMMLSGGFGRMTPPLQTFQWVPSYRFSYNKNLSAEAKQYEFFANTGSLFVNIKPLAKTSGGVKLEGNFTFQNSPSVPGDSASSYVFQKFSMTGEGGLFIRHQLNKQVRFDWEGSVRPQTYYATVALSGIAYLTRISARGDFGSNFWNPGASAGFEMNNTDGLDYRYQSISAGFNNMMRLPGANNVTMSLDLQMLNYPKSALLRKDKMLTPRMSWMKSINPRWALIGDVTYIVNSSNIASSFTYNRAMASLGASVSF